MSPLYKKLSKIFHKYLNCKKNISIMINLYKKILSLSELYINISEMPNFYTEYCKKFKIVQIV